MADKVIALDSNVNHDTRFEMGVSTLLAGFLEAGNVRDIDMSVGSCFGNGMAAKSHGMPKAAAFRGRNGTRVASHHGWRTRHTSGHFGLDDMPA
jgi:hypothetical protein